MEPLEQSAALQAVLTRAKPANRTAVAFFLNRFTVVALAAEAVSA